MTMRPGTRLAHYEILEPLGKGGMGEVWKARDTKLSREVAIKTLPEEFAKDGDRLARFEREAKLLASLNHPNIAAIYGLEEQEGRRFLVLELVEGETLADRLKRGAIPVEESLELALQIVDALEAAHGNGIIHRDLKPANIKITPEGRVKVLDFGLAKAFGPSGSDVSLSNSPTVSVAATQGGVILGTAAYMSPEQARGQDVDRRADIWAFGCVLYEMMVGKAAFEGDTVSDILAGVLRAVPDWTRLPPNLHPRLRFIFDRCLEKVPADRGHDIADVRIDIRKVLDDPDGLFVTPVGPSSPTLSRRSVLTLGATALGAAGIGGVLGWRSRVPPSPLVTRLLVRGDLRFAISRDGRTLAYVVGQQIYRRGMAEFSGQPIPGAEGLILDVAFSPDGEWVAYTESGIGILRIPIGGGTPQTVARVGLSLTPPAGLRWEDTDTIVYTVPEGIMEVPVDGGELPAAIVAPQPNEQLGAAQLLPDGDSILFSATRDTGDTRWDAGEILLQSRSSGVRTTLVRGGSAARYLPDGYLVYGVGNALKAVRYPPSSSDTRDHVTVLEGVGRSTQDLIGRVLYVLSDKGDLVYADSSEVESLFSSLSQTELVWVDPGDSEEELDGVTVSGLAGVSVSPDGRWAALQREGLSVLDLQTGSLVDLASGFILSPVWSPDSERIYFHRNPDLGSGVTEVAAVERGGGEVSVVASFQGETMSPSAITRDGRTLLGSLRYPETSRSDIVALGTDGKMTEILTGNPIRNEPDLSPDGRWLAYTESTGEGEARVVLRPYPDVGRFFASVEGPGRSPRFSADGSEIYYYDTEGISAVSVAYDPNPRFGQPRPLVRGPYLFGMGVAFGTYVGRAWDWDPTRARFLIIRRAVAPAGPEAGLNLRVVQNWREEFASRLANE